MTWDWDECERKERDEYEAARARAGMTPLAEGDESGLPLWRYTWRDPFEDTPLSFEAFSGSRGDADRQLVDHLRGLGLSKVTSFLDAEQSVCDLQLQLIMDHGPAEPPLPIFDLGLLDGPPPPDQRWALNGFIPAGEVTLWTGGGGVGKSLTAQQLATCIAVGQRFLRLEVECQPVLYVTAEDAFDVLHRRQRAINAMVQPDMDWLRESLFLSSLRGRLGNQLCTFDDKGRIVPSETFHKLRASIKANGVQIVFLDNLAHLFAGNENDRMQVTQFVNLLYSIVMEMGVTVVLIAHPNKSGDEFSGSTAWLNAVRSHLHLSHDKASDLLTLTTSKANYARKGNEVSFMWWQGAYIHADDVPPDVASQNRETAQASSDNALFLACLAETTARQQTISDKPTASNFAPKLFARMAESKGIGRERLDRAMDRLFRIRAIERGELPWRGADRHAAEGLRETVRDGLREGCG